MDTKQLVDFTLDLNNSLRVNGYATVTKRATLPMIQAFRALADRLGCEVVDTGHVFKLIAPQYMGGHKCTERILIPVQGIDKNWISDWDNDHGDEIMTIAATALRVAASARDHKFEAGLAYFVFSTEKMNLGETTNKRFADLLKRFLGRIDRINE